MLLNTEVKGRLVRSCPDRVSANDGEETGKLKILKCFAVVGQVVSCVLETPIGKTFSRHVAG